MLPLVRIAVKSGGVRTMLIGPKEVVEVLFTRKKISTKHLIVVCIHHRSMKY